MKDRKGREGAKITGEYKQKLNENRNQLVQLRE
jgi:hypothetical protein